MYHPVCDVVQNYLDTQDALDEVYEQPAAVCPYCGGSNTELVSEDELHGEETHVCWQCEVAFEIDVIPWMRSK